MKTFKILALLFIAIQLLFESVEFNTEIAVNENPILCTQHTPKCKTQKEHAKKLLIKPSNSYNLVLR